MDDIRSNLILLKKISGREHLLHEAQGEARMLEILRREPNISALVLGIVMTDR